MGGWHRVQQLEQSVNIAAITAKVRELVPDAADVRTRDAGGGVWALVCTLAGRTHSVQFDAAGLYGAASGMWGALLQRTDDYIAGEIAEELRK